MSQFVSDISMFALIWFVVGFISTLPNPLIHWGNSRDEKLITFGCLCVLSLVMGPFLNALLWLADKLNKRSENKVGNINE